MEKEERSSWSKLYDVALKIQALKPWESMYNSDLIYLLLPGHEAPVYCSIMGIAGECIGIAMYYDLEAQIGFQKQLSTEMTYPSMLDYNKCFVCYWGARDEISNKDYALIKELGFKFRGKTSWIYFRHMEPPYCPSELTPNDVDFVFDIMSNLYMALGSYLTGALHVDFESGQMLVRSYDDDSKLWYNQPTDLMFPEIKYPTAAIRDDLLIARLKKMKKSNITIEADIANTGQAVSEKKGGRAYFYRLVIIAAHDAGLVISFDDVSVNDDEIDLFLRNVIGFIESNGRPRQIIARERYAALLDDLCSKLDIELVVDEHPDVIEDFIQTMLNGPMF